MAGAVAARIAPGLSGAEGPRDPVLNYDSSTKVLALTARRFWETDDGIYGGGTFTDLPTGIDVLPVRQRRARDPHVSASPAVMLASYSWGQTARSLASLDAPGAQRDRLRHLARVHPQLADAGMVRRTASLELGQPPTTAAVRSRGSCRVSTTALIATSWRRRPIFFAGEHASLTHTWMQGALESGLRATRELLESAQRA